MIDKNKWFNDFYNKFKKNLGIKKANLTSNFNGSVPVDLDLNLSLEITPVVTVKPKNKSSYESIEDKKKDKILENKKHDIDLNTASDFKQDSEGDNEDDKLNSILTKSPSTEKVDSNPPSIVGQKGEEDGEENFEKENNNLDDQEIIKQIYNLLNKRNNNKKENRNPKEVSYPCSMCRNYNISNGNCELGLDPLAAQEIGSCSWLNSTAQAIAWDNYINRENKRRTLPTASLASDTGLEKLSHTLSESDKIVGDSEKPIEIRDNVVEDKNKKEKDEEGIVTNFYGADALINYTDDAKKVPIKNIKRASTLEIEKIKDMIRETLQNVEKKDLNYNSLMQSLQENFNNDLSKIKIIQLIDKFHLEDLIMDLYNEVKSEPGIERYYNIDIESPKRREPRLALEKKFELNKNSEITKDNLNEIYEMLDFIYKFNNLIPDDDEIELFLKESERFKYLYPVWLKMSDEEKEKAKNKIFEKYKKEIIEVNQKELKDKNEMEELEDNEDDLQEKENIKIASILKTAYIRKIKNKNKWCVFSESGRNMGCYYSKDEAKKRLRQIEYFKHKK